MRHRTLRNALVAACFLLGPAHLASQARQEASSEPELRRLSVEWMQAWKDRDRAKLERVLANDFVLVISASPDRPITRAAWLEYAARDYVCESFEYKSQHVRLLGDTAIVASNYTQKASVGGEDRSGDFFLTDVWQRRDGRWQVVARYSAKPEAAATARSVLPKKQLP